MSNATSNLPRATFSAAKDGGVKTFVEYRESSRIAFPSKRMGGKPEVGETWTYMVIDDNKAHTVWIVKCVDRVSEAPQSATSPTGKPAATTVAAAARALQTCTEPRSRKPSFSNLANGRPTMFKQNQAVTKVWKPKFKVAAPNDFKDALKPYNSKWVMGNNGSLIAAIRIDGRVVFAEGPQPKADGKNYAFQLVGENAKQTVFTARIIENKDDAPLVISKLSNGRLVCSGQSSIVLHFRSSKPSKEVPFAEYRSARYLDELFVANVGCSRCDEDESADDTDHSAFAQETEAPIWASKSRNPVSCCNCGFEDCRCDGTGSDWGPVRTTLNVLA